MVEEKETVPASEEFTLVHIWWAASCVGAVALSFFVLVAGYVYSLSGDPVKVELLSTNQLRVIAGGMSVIAAACLAYTIVRIVRSRGTWRIVPIICAFICLCLLLACLFSIYTAEADFSL